jgi:DEAD/DEAH box helicase domain-containing protein
MDKSTSIRRVLEAAGFEITDARTVPAREPSLRPIPRFLPSAVQAFIQARYPGGLYTHQADAVQAVHDGRDACLATSTSSGKTLAFQAAAADVLGADPKARVLVLYPARALIQDQIGKWEPLCRALDVPVRLIDGSVPVAVRAGILQDARVILMTPDVAHAWLMSSAAQREVATFLRNLRLLVLDETHVYDGVFGTNAAFLLRRLQAVAGPHRLLCSTATVADPTEFVRELTGREVVVFDASHDGAGAPEKTILLVRPAGRADAFDGIVHTLQTLADAHAGRFLAFGDSRKMVEQIVSAVLRDREAEDAAEGADTDQHDVTARGRRRVLPYRAGYESEDRRAIQSALQEGKLAGVVSTSALELGLDIGDIDLVLLLGPPPSVKAFWQRFGRAGRRDEGVCVLFDRLGKATALQGGLADFLARPLEPNRLYLDNRYLQYANALCTAAEAKASPGRYEGRFLADLPESFGRMLANELDPKEMIPADLYGLKQRAQGSPHHEFPLRSAVEPNYAVCDRDDHSYGTLNYSQVLREAYPGAIYYYLARPYRVRQISRRDHQIRVHRDRRATTSPIRQVMVFPNFDNGILASRRAGPAFLVEAHLQVSERVMGFVEKHGKVENTHEYQPGSPYAESPLSRFFETSGVCLGFPGLNGARERVAEAIMNAFCALCGVQPADVGIGPFHARTSPFSDSPVNGMCIYDATYGSLRLTSMLVDRFEAIVTFALDGVRSGAIDGVEGVVDGLERVLQQARGLAPCASDASSLQPAAQEPGWLEVIAPGQTAMFVGNSTPTEVKVLRYRYTPSGLFYDLEPPDPSARWSTRASSLTPIHGLTRKLLVNFETGEERPVDGGA